MTCQSFLDSAVEPFTAWGRSLHSVEVESFVHENTLFKKNDTHLSAFCFPAGCCQLSTLGEAPRRPFAES